MWIKSRKYFIESIIHINIYIKLKKYKWKQKLLLILLPLSYIVVSIREAANKHIFYTSASTPNSTMTDIPSNVDKDDIRE